MRVKPRGILWMMPAAWRNPLPGVLWQARKAWPEGRLVARMNKLTLLAALGWSLRGAAAGAHVGEADRQRKAGVKDSRGKLLLSSWANPNRSICNTICNSRAPLGYGWASVALRPAYGV
jgi:hypothetical protein